MKFKNIIILVVSLFFLVSCNNIKKAVADVDSVWAYAGEDGSFKITLLKNNDLEFSNSKGDFIKKASWSYDKETNTLFLIPNKDLVYWDEFLFTEDVPKNYAKCFNKYDRVNKIAGFKINQSPTTSKYYIDFLGYYYIKQ